MECVKVYRVRFLVGWVGVSGDWREVGAEEEEEKIHHLP